MMLRAGAKVIVTTRFAHDSAARYAREEDYEDWRDRLQIHGLDLRHSPSVEIFARFILSTERRLDILINNAAQTVRRPTAVLRAHGRSRERLPLRTSSIRTVRRLLRRAYEACKEAIALDAPQLASSPALVAHGTSSVPQTWAFRSGFGGAATGDRAFCRLGRSSRRCPCAFEDDAHDSPSDFSRRCTPTPICSRSICAAMNSWRMTLADVPTRPRCWRCSWSTRWRPSSCAAQLKEPDDASSGRARSTSSTSRAMEGKFARGIPRPTSTRTPTWRRPSLNMMTLTSSAPDYAAQSGIFMNAVDTGWVTDEDPAASLQRAKAGGPRFPAPARHRRRRRPHLRPVLRRHPQRRARVGEVPEGLQAHGVVKAK